MHNRSRFLKSSGGAAKATTRKRNATISASARKYNFSAGPAMLPLDVLEEAQEDLVNYKGTEFVRPGNVLSRERFSWP